MKKNSNAIAYIRQLCCLGLGKEAIVPELLHSIKSILTSEGNVFVGVDENIVSTYAIPEYKVPEALAAFTDEHTRVITPELQTRITQWYHSNRILPDLGIVYRDVYQTDLYHLVWRPYNQHHGMQCLIKHNGIPAGTLALFRPRNLPSFTSEECRLLEYLLPYFDHAMEVRNEIGTDYVDSEEAGMLIMRRSGAVVFQSESVWNLLHLATYGTFPIKKCSNHAILPVLKQLCQNLESIFQGKDAAPPTLSLTNSSGRYIFRAFLLDTNNREPSGLIAINVTRQEPFQLKVLRNMYTLNQTTQHWYTQAASGRG